MAKPASGRSAAVTAVAAAAAVVVAGCAGDDGGVEPRTITVEARDGLLVAVDVGTGWEVHPAGVVTFPEPGGLYRLAVTCRGDLGDTRFVLAAPGDDPVHDLDCITNVTGSAEVWFDVTGDVDEIYVAGAGTDSPLARIQVAPGRYDVVATQLAVTEVGGPARLVRAQVVHDIAVEGSTRVPVDVEGLGTPVEPVMVHAEPAAADYLALELLTARGTRALLGAAPPRRLPAASLAPGDRHWLTAGWWLRQAGRWHLVYAEVPADGHEVAVTRPAHDDTVHFAAEPRPAVTWSSVDGWESATFRLLRGQGAPGWTVTASAAALALGAELAAQEPPPGWLPAWDVDLTADYTWWTTLSRARPDGGREWVDVVVNVTP